MIRDDRASESVADRMAHTYVCIRRDACACDRHVGAWRFEVQGRASGRIITGETLWQKKEKKEKNVLVKKRRDSTRNMQRLKSWSIIVAMRCFGEIFSRGKLFSPRCLAEFF